MKSEKAPDFKTPSMTGICLFAFLIANYIGVKTHDTYHVLVVIALALTATFFLVFVAPLPWQVWSRKEPKQLVFLIFAYLAMVIVQCGASSLITVWLGCHSHFWPVLRKTLPVFLLFYTPCMAVGGYALDCLQRQRGAPSTLPQRLAYAQAGPGCGMQSAPIVCQKRALLPKSTGGGLVVRCDDKPIVLKPKDLTHFTIKSRKVYAHGTRGRHLTDLPSLDSAAAICGGETFYVRRNTLVRMDAVVRLLTRWEKQYVLVATGEELEVSYSYSRRLPLLPV